MSSPSPFVVRERVRWADVDLVGIMRFSAVTRLVEMAEQELLREAGLPYSMIFSAPEIWMPRRHLTIEYFSPARIDDELALVTYISRLGDTSLTVNVDVRHATTNRLVATAVMVVVCVTVAAFAKRPLPRVVREALTPFVHAAVDMQAEPPRTE